MMVIISYDIAINYRNGAERLRKIAKLCQDYGIRVQNSVFECNVDYQTYLFIKKKLSDIMDNKVDSIRFYELGNNFQGHIVHIGAKKTWDFVETLMI